MGIKKSYIGSKRYSKKLGHKILIEDKEELYDFYKNQGFDDIFTKPRKANKDKEEVKGDKDTAEQ